MGRHGQCRRGIPSGRRRAKQTLEPRLQSTDCVEAAVPKNPSDIDFIPIDDLLATDTADADPGSPQPRSPTQMPLPKAPPHPTTGAFKKIAETQAPAPPADAVPAPGTVAITPPNAEKRKAAINPRRRTRSGNDATMAAATGVLLILLAAGMYLFFSPQSPAPAPVDQASRTFDVPSAPVIKPEPAESPQPLPDDGIQPAAASPPITAQAPAASAPAIDLEASVGDFLAVWQAAWEGSAGPDGNLADYLNCYGPDFTVAGMDKAAWAAEKGVKNRRKDWIRVRLSRIRVTPPAGGDTVSVTFSQDYASSNYSETSEKTLLLKRSGPSWQIIGTR